MTIRAVQDRVIVKPVQSALEAPLETPGPEAGPEQPLEGQVVAISRGGWPEDDSSPLVTVGDRVSFFRHAASKLKLSGETYLIVDQSQVLDILAPAGKSVTRAV